MRRKNPPYRLMYVDMISSAVRKWKVMSLRDQKMIAQLAEDNNLLYLIPRDYLLQIGIIVNPSGRAIGILRRS